MQKQRVKVARNTKLAWANLRVRLPSNLLGYSRFVADKFIRVECSIQVL